MEALQLGGTMTLEEVTERSAFLALEDEWDALVSRTQDEVFLRHAFARVWLDNFAPREEWRVLLARDATGVLRAALPLVVQRGFLVGVPVRELSGAANVHSCRFDLLCETQDAAELILRRLLREDDWDVLRLTDVPLGGAGEALLQAGLRLGCPVGTWESLRSPYLSLPDSFEAVLERLDGKFKANLRRRRRKLEQKGKVSVERVTGGPKLLARLEEGLELERRGWKGQQGTAISQDRATRGFYRELSTNLAHQGMLSLYFLRLDGRAVAFHYALEHRGRYLLLKPGYDEALGECSPGQLLMEDVLRDLVQRDVREFDFLGPWMTWKQDWTDQVRVHRWLYLFRPGRLGRALHAAKFRLGPLAKNVVTRWTR